MKKSKALKILLTAIYIIGITLTLYYAARYLIHSGFVANPDAMIPFADYEAAFICMALGCPLMALSAVSVIWAYDLRKTARPKRNILLVLIPAIIDGIPFLISLAFVLFLIFEGFLNSMGIELNL